MFHYTFLKPKMLFSAYINTRFQWRISSKYSFFRTLTDSKFFYCCDADEEEDISDTVVYFDDRDKCPTNVVGRSLSGHRFALRSLVQAIAHCRLDYIAVLTGTTDVQMKSLYEIRWLVC